MVKRKRISKAELDARIQSLLRLYGQGYTKTAVLCIAQEQWGLSTRQINHYRQQLEEVLSALNNQPPELAYADLLRKFQDLYRRAIQDGNHELALTMEGDQQELLRQVQLELAHHSSGSSGSNLLSLEEIEKALQEIAKQSA